MRVTYAIEPEHHRAAELCATRCCGARLCAIWSGFIEGHP